MLENSYGDETLEELTPAIIMLKRIQPTDDNVVTKPNYDAKAVIEVNASHKMIPKGVHEHKNHEKRKTVVNTSVDDQIDSNIVFDDPYLAKKAFKERENQYLEDIVDLEEKLSSHDRIVYKMGQSIQTIYMLGKTPNKVYDPFLKAKVGYQNPERLKKTIATQPKMYHGEMLQSTNFKIHSPDSEETLKDTEEKQKVEETSPKDNIFQNEIDRLLEVSLTQEIQDCVLISVEEQENELLKDEIKKNSSDSKDIQANLLKRIKIPENDFKRSQAQSIDFELKVQHQKEKMAYDVSWKSSLSKLSDENMSLKTQVDSVVPERENIKLEYQNLFNSIKAT
ncbi:hypothetical protein Tco_0066624 [Tanacetum coccineum]